MPAVIAMAWVDCSVAYEHLCIYQKGKWPDLSTPKLVEI